MRTTFVFLGALAAFAAAVPPKEQKEYEYPRYIQFPDGQGVPHTVDLLAVPDINALLEIQSDADSNLYLLFTRLNPTTSQPLNIDDANSILNSNFNPNATTVVVAHGWSSNQDTLINPSLRDTFLNKGDINVIILDWSYLAELDYATATLGVPAAGRDLGQFLRFVNQVTGAPYSSMHLVGFSLGAHLVGNAGRELGGAVARITGLDAAGPLWNLNSNRLGPNDGIYVEAIHTDDDIIIGGLGIGFNIANSDFYPNGGKSQPGCLDSICNHKRSWELFGSSVTYDHFVGRQCASDWQLTWNLCSGTALNMGNDDLAKTGSGIYRVNTEANYPY